MIYFDYQASTPVDPDVVAAMAPFHSRFFGNPHAGDHAEGWRARSAVDDAVAGLAEVLNADPDEILITSGATESNNLAILGLARRAPSSRNRILLSAIEHKSVLAAADVTRRIGFKVDLLPVDDQGLVDLGYLESSLGDDVLLVSVLAVSNEIGTIEAVAEVARLAHAAGAYVHTDAAQALTAVVPDVDAWDVDLLSISGHKIYGPKGVGALFARRHLQGAMEPLMYGGGQQGGLRSGTVPVALCVGLNAAAHLMTGERAERERVRIGELRDAFVAGLTSRQDTIQVNGPPPRNRHPGNANLRFEGLDARDLLAAMQPEVAASSGSACVSGSEEPSYVLQAIGLTRQSALSSIRFSLGRFTTESEVTDAVDKILLAIEGL